MGKNYDDARAERSFNLDPPSNAPGQGIDVDLFGDDGSGGSNNFSSVDGSDMNVNSILNSSGVSTQMGTQDPNQALKEYTKNEDYIWGIIKKGGLWFLKGLVALVKSFSNNKEGDWHRFGEQLTKLSLGTFCVGICMVVLSPFFHFRDPFLLSIGSILPCATGLFIVYKNSKNGEYAERLGSEGKKEEPIPAQEDSMEDLDLSNLFDDDSVEESSQEPVDDWSDEDDSCWDNVFADDGDSLFEDSGDAIDGDFDVEKAVSEVADIPQGTQTRQFLYETFTRVLPYVNPQFSTMEEVVDGSDEFMMFEEYLNEALQQSGAKELPMLRSVSKNMFIYQLVADRFPGLKEQLIADEVANLYSREGETRVVHDNVHATVDSVGSSFIINVFTGKSCMVSLNDIYKKISSFVLDPKVTMPFVWGIDEFGDVHYCDLIKCDSIIISGEPRSGKSWKGQSIIAQLCMFSSPKEVEFYIFDHKSTSSDYFYLSKVLPHVKYFCGSLDKINSGIQTIIERVSKERNQIFKEAGAINIADYNATHPDNKLSYVYVVVDELMSMMDAYAMRGKDEDKTFKSLMSTLVSKTPNLGIRLIIFPHRIVDRIISKDAYTLVSSRAIVGQLNQDEVANAVGVSKREFQYVLANKGDMALRTKDIANGKAVFNHAECLTLDNDGNKKLFEFIGSVWKKLEPDCKCIEMVGDVGGSLMGDKAIRVSSKNKSVKDNTNGKQSYSLEEITEDTDFTMEDDVDEEFWNNF